MTEKQTKKVKQLRDVKDDPTVSNELEKLAALQTRQSAGLSRRDELQGLLSGYDAETSAVAVALGDLDDSGLREMPKLQSELEELVAGLEIIAIAAPIQRQRLADAKRTAGAPIVEAEKPAYAKQIAASCQLLRDFVASQKELETYRNDLVGRSTLNGLPVIRFQRWDVITDRMPDPVRIFFHNVEASGFSTTTSKNGS